MNTTIKEQEMRLAIDIGHNVPFDKGCPGLEGGKSEDELTKELGEYLIQGLRNHQHIVFDVTPIDASSLFNSLWQRIRGINECSLNYFLSLHFNCGGGSGTEFYYNGERGKQLGEKLVEKIEQVTGLKGKVFKGNTNSLTYYTNVAGGILEVCYCDNPADMALYNKEKISYAIIDVMDELATIRQTRKKRSAHQ